MAVDRRPEATTRTSMRASAGRAAIEEVRQRGQVTFLGVGLAIALLFIGGFAIDLWRVLATRTELAEVADAAAAAGANGVDLAHLRATGQLRLDPGTATAMASANLSRQLTGEGAAVTVTGLDATDETVTVALQGEVPLTLLRIFTLAEPITVAVTAEAVPVRGP